MADHRSSELNMGLGLLAVLGLSAAGGLLVSRASLRLLVNRAVRLLSTEPLEGNLWELPSSVARVGVNTLVANELRAHFGRPVDRPIGGPTYRRIFSNLMFQSAQLVVFPTPNETKVDMSVRVGPLAARPLQLDIPILIAGMAYGVALSKPYKIALARGATAAGTATNTGLGPWLPEERKAAERLILQYSRTSWNKEPSIISQADAIEIQFGQGANAGVGKTRKASLFGTEARVRMGLRPGQPAKIHARFAEVQTPGDLRVLVDRLRRITGGVPIGVKIAAGKYLEQDLDIIVDAGADFVSLDGSEAGTHNSTPLLQEAFGLPTLMAVSRAGRYWEEHGLRGRVSLLVGGGLFSPADCLKTLALGADAVYLGTVVLMATAHTQVLKVNPYEPPTQLAYESGRFRSRFSVAGGAKSCANFLNALAQELAEGVRALGKTAIADVGREDLMALDRETAEITGTELAYRIPATPRPRSATSVAPARAAAAVIPKVSSNSTRFARAKPLPSTSR